MRAIGIYRELEFSPGKVEADAAILDAVLARLRAVGFDAEAIKPGAISDAACADIVLAMCQSEDALEKLASIERSGAVVVNSPRAIRNCYRDHLGDILARAGVPIPPGALVSTLEGKLPRLPEAAPDAPSPSRHDCCETDRNNRAASPSPRGRGWASEARSRSGAEPPENCAGDELGMLDLSAAIYVKRGDLHALSPQDVVRVEGVAQLRRMLERFRRRGVGLAYVQQAVQGTVVKFYGVSGGEFFRALSERHDLSGAVSQRLRAAASHAASALGLQAWGGDAVIGNDGRFWIIDFNDWPSYSRVLGEAAPAIARRAIALLRDRESMWRVDASGEKA